ncbi:MAG: YdcF family protein [Proteobacteria bacterium]|nr:YdcF family protein [Pseudomonadota bacterium]
MTGRVRIAGIAAAAFLIAGAAGFAWFVGEVRRPPDLPAHADGIVALTGGADRIETALRLLAEGRAGKLLVSGTGGNADLAQFARRAGVDPDPLVERVTLGRSAISTRGNAEETADWARANAIRSLIVVTASYHMPRALAEIRRASPDVVLYPDPVTPAALRDGGVAGRVAALRLVASEYVKFVAASLDLTALLPSHRPPAAAPAQHDGTGRDAAPHEGVRAS